MNQGPSKRNKHVIITPKRRFNVIITCLLRSVFAGKCHLYCHILTGVVKRCRVISSERDIVRSIHALVYDPPTHPSWYFRTHSSLNKIADLWQTTFSNVFLWLNCFVVRFKFHQSLSIGIQLTCVSPGDGLVPKRQAIAWTNGDPVQWRAYASPGANELIAMFMVPIGHSQVWVSLWRLIAKS